MRGELAIPVFIADLQAILNGENPISASRPATSSIFPRMVSGYNVFVRKVMPTAQLEFASLAISFGTTTTMMINSNAAGRGLRLPWLQARGIGTCGEAFGRLFLVNARSFGYDEKFDLREAAKSPWA